MIRTFSLAVFEEHSYRIRFEVMRDISVLTHSFAVHISISYDVVLVEWLTNVLPTSLTISRWMMFSTQFNSITCRYLGCESVSNKWKLVKPLKNDPICGCMKRWRRLQCVTQVANCHPMCCRTQYTANMHTESQTQRVHTLTDSLSWALSYAHAIYLKNGWHRA